MYYELPEFGFKVNITDKGTMLNRNSLQLGKLNNNVAFMFATKQALYACLVRPIPKNFCYDTEVEQNLKALVSGKTALLNGKTVHQGVKLNTGEYAEMAWIDSARHRELQVTFIWNSMLYCLSATVTADEQIDEQNYTDCPMQAKLFRIIASFRELPHTL